jgi:hypothetical protein
MQENIQRNGEARRKDKLKDNTEQVEKEANEEDENMEEMKCKEIE